MKLEIAVKEGTILPPPSPSRIKWFEKSYRVKLPRDYVSFLKAYNGASPIVNGFRQGRRQRMIESFLCMLDKPRDDSQNGWRDIAVVLTQLDSRLIDDENLVGMNVVPFASLFAGDFICFDFRDDASNPSISVWDHERSEDLAPHLEQVASSFSEFIQLLG